MRERQGSKPGQPRVVLRRASGCWLCPANSLRPISGSRSQSLNSDLLCKFTREVAGGLCSPLWLTVSSSAKGDPGSSWSVPWGFADDWQTYTGSLKLTPYPMTLAGSVSRKGPWPGRLAGVSHPVLCGLNNPWPGRGHQETEPEVFCQTPALVRQNLSITHFVGRLMETCIFFGQ